MIRNPSVSSETGQGGNGAASATSVNASVDPETAASSGELTIYDLTGTLWENRRSLVLFTAAFLLAGVAYLLGTRSEYRSSAMLMPERISEQGMGNLGLLRQFSGLLGTALPADILRSSTQIPADLYPEVAKSTALQLTLLQREVRVAGIDRPLPLYEYLAEHKTWSLWESAGQALQAIPELLLPASGESSVVIPSGADTTIIRLSRDQLRLLDDLRTRLRADFDVRQNVVTVSATMPDPDVAAQVAQGLVAELTRFVTEYRSNHYQRKLAFINELHTESRERFNRALHDLASFRDSHRNLTRDRARTEEQRLEAEYELAFSLYNSLASRLEEAKIQVQEETAVFKVLQPVTVPIRRSHPPSLAILLLSSLCGLMVGSLFVVFRPSWSRFGRIFFK